MACPVNRTRCLTTISRSGFLQGVVSETVRRCDALNGGYVDASEAIPGQTGKVARRLNRTRSTKCERESSLAWVETAAARPSNAASQRASRFRRRSILHGWSRLPSCGCAGRPTRSTGRDEEQEPLREQRITTKQRYPDPKPHRPYTGLPKLAPAELVRGRQPYVNQTCRVLWCGSCSLWRGRRSTFGRGARFRRRTRCRRGRSRGLVMAMPAMVVLSVVMMLGSGRRLGRRLGGRRRLRRLLLSLRRRWRHGGWGRRLSHHRQLSAVRSLLRRDDFGLRGRRRGRITRGSRGRRLRALHPGRHPGTRAKGQSERSEGGYR